MATTTHLNAEIMHQLSYISDNESLLVKALEAIKSIVVKYKAETPENAIIKADLSEALSDLKKKRNGEMNYSPIEELLDELNSHTPNEL